MSLDVNPLDKHTDLSGKALRTLTAERDRNHLIGTYNQPHHQRLLNAVNSELKRAGAIRDSGLP
jgi:hypothetical protein